MKLKSLICGLAVLAAVACEEDKPVVTPSLDVSATTVSFEAVPTDATFTVTTNQAWTATVDADWVTVTPASGEASETAATVTVSATENTATEERTATVTVTAGELVKTVSVSQAAAAGPVMPTIPADYVAETLWEGSKDLAWGTAVQDLAYGAYNWASRKPGEYLKITVAATDASKDYILQVNYAGPDGWQAIADYTNVEVIVMELTEDNLALFAAPNDGFIIQGDNVTAKKIELYKAPGADAPAEFTNLFTNSDFESGTDPWMGWWSGYTQEQGEGREGGKAMVLTLDAITNMWEAQIAQDVTALEVGTYAYEFYAKTDAAPHQVQVYGQELESGTYGGIYGGYHELTAEWAHYSGEIEYTGDPAAITRIGIQFGKADSAGVKVYLDDFKFGPKK